MEHSTDDRGDHASASLYEPVAVQPKDKGIVVPKTGDESGQTYLDLPTGIAVDGALRAQEASPARNGTSVKLPATPWRSRVASLWESNKGVVLMILAQFFGSFMAAIARLMETNTGDRAPLNPFQILFARQSVTVVLSLAYMWWCKVPEAPFGPSELRPLLAARGFGGFFGVIGLYLSLLYLPLSDAIVMTFLAPMLAAWISSFLIKTPFTRTQRLAGLIAILGVLFITQPFSLASSPTTPSSEIDSVSVSPNSTAPNIPSSAHKEPTPSQRAIAVACGVLGICGAASAYVTISWIGKRAHPLISVTYFSAWCTFVSAAAMLFVPSIGFRMPATLHEWTLLTALGVSGFIMQFLLTASLAHKRSNRVLNMVYSQMLFALAFDKLMFDEVPGLLSWLGSGLILGSVFWVAIKNDTADSGNKEQRAEVQRNVVEDEETAGLIDGEDYEGEEDISQEDSDSRCDQATIEMQDLRR